ncbi:MAG TPA: pitrilysin family protein [Bryobacteraceae bacterium]|jgi:predicted Zn-dependent peptidase|nr:pitrilysin family protein [Bryobacteraceae bacterium]
MHRVLSLVAALVLSVAPAFSQESFQEVQKRISEFTLKNGMKFIVLERHQAPVASFYIYVDAGTVQEPAGKTGIAHMMEHMAFKGTSTIGSKNYAEEKNSIEHVDKLFYELRAERDKGAKADPEKLKKLEADFKAAQEAAMQFVEPNEFGRAIEEAGGRGLNASTAMDKTDYFFSLPSNSAELWFFLESERFRDPVYREFFKERDVVREERRMRTESNPIGKAVEEFLAVAYKAHPYGNPGVGHASDIENYTRQDALEFFKKYYIPANTTAVIVGDVDPKEMKRLAEMYFGRLPTAEKPDIVRTTEPPQPGERRVTLHLNAQRVLVMGYHKPASTDPENAVYEAIGSILSDGRSSRLYRSLVQDKKLAVAAAGQEGFPGNKYPNLFLFYAFTAPGKTNDEVEKAMLAEIERLKNEPVSKEELDAVKARERASMIHMLQDNTGMAQSLAAYQVLFGDWRKLFDQLNELEKVTPEAIQRVAKKTFSPENRSVATIEPAQQASSNREASQ